MKTLRLFLTTLLAASSMAAIADDIDGTLYFVDEQGNVIEHGTELTIKGLTPESAYADAYIDSGIYVVNSSNTQVGVGLTLTITRIDSGQLSCCFPSSCNAQTTVLTDYDNGKGFMSANEKKTLQTEYTPLAGNYSTCTATFQLRLHEDTGALNPGEQIATGPSITVNFVYDETSAGIAGVAADKSAVVGYYTLDGKQLSAPQAGVNVVRYADGTAEKTLFRNK